MAGCADALRSVGFDQGQRAQIGAEVLFRVGRSAITISQKAVAAGPVLGACASLLAGVHAAKRRWAEGIYSHVVASNGCAYVARNLLTAMKYLDPRAILAEVDLLFEQREGHGIPKAVDFDMIIGCDTGAFLPREHIGLSPFLMPDYRETVDPDEGAQAMRATKLGYRG